MHKKYISDNLAPSVDYTMHLTRIYNLKCEGIIK